MAECPILVASQAFLTHYDQVLGNTTEQSVGTYVRVFCVDGYTLSGAEVVQCTAAGWSPQPTPSCSVQAGSSGATELERQLRAQLGDAGYVIFVVGLVLAALVLITLIVLCAIYFRRLRRNKKSHGHYFRKRAAPPPIYATVRDAYPSAGYGYSGMRDMPPSPRAARRSPRKVFSYHDDMLEDPYPYPDDQYRTTASDPFNLNSRDLFWTHMPHLDSRRERPLVLPRVHRSDTMRMTRSDFSLDRSRGRDLRSLDRYQRRGRNFRPGASFGYGWNPM